MTSTIRVTPAPGVSIVHGALMDAVSPNLSHRDGGILFRTLFEGERGDDDRTDEEQGRSDRANNYILFLSTQHAFQSPVHHHNFEQFRYAIKGDVSLGPGAVIHQNELAFTGEGVYYGPQNDDENERVILILQYGGSSGQGFTSPSTLQSSNRALQELGTFRSGKYHAHPPSDTTSTPAPIDGYQALWEHANSPAKLTYPAPQYDKSLVIKPRNFSWTPVPGAAAGTSGSTYGALSRRHLGTFTQREVRVQQWRLEPGAEMVLPGISGEVEAEQLIFVLRGKGKVMGEAVMRETAIRVRMGARVAREGGVRIVADVAEKGVANDGYGKKGGVGDDGEDGEGAMVLLHWILPRV